MQVYNVVKFRVKQGEEAAFLDAHRHLRTHWRAELLEGAAFGAVLDVDPLAV